MKTSILRNSDKTTYTTVTYSSNICSAKYSGTVLRHYTGILFVRARRERDFSLCVERLKELVPWLFSLDYQNYSRWLSVNVRDMEYLTRANQQFEVNGNWVVQKHR